ncbi:hypothetical protein [Granulicoccus phenolivorans]|uniref:hypothetical protein n=1 Tax=Granulicoccus phenolivorans TaxID=266854 RepID=UPI00047EE946|nr:hypothetical protein [Granulicoccus phenolivorans]
MPRQVREHLDSALRDWLRFLPEEPGIYEDGHGDYWELHADGSWTDHLGQTRGPEWQGLVALFGPMTRVTAGTGRG